MRVRKLSFVVGGMFALILAIALWPHPARFALPRFANSIKEERNSYAYFLKAKLPREAYDAYAGKLKLSHFPAGDKTALLQAVSPGTDDFGPEWWQWVSVSTNSYYSIGPSNSFQRLDYKDGFLYYWQS